MDAVINKLNQVVYRLDDFSSTFVRETVNALEDGILYTSIPYYRGFKVRVDGEEADIVKIANALCGVKLTAGKHEIIFTYRPYGLMAGIGMSILGFALLITFLLFERRSIKMKNSD